MSPRVWSTRGLGVSVVQVLWKCPLTDERYVTQRAWEGAILDRCPFHPEGGCGVEKLGSYGRVEPAGARIPRWWCPKQRESISLLPSFLAARLTGTLADVERVVEAVEAAGSIAAAVDAVHPPDAEKAVGLVCALRSIRRRVRAVRAALLAIATLMPERFAAVSPPTLAAFREALGGDGVLVRLREFAERYLGVLPVPLGFRARARG
ncbi:MAG TPA: hypothetical protein VI072_19445 [Polyangiaceae bacterium]